VFAPPPTFSLNTVRLTSLESSLSAKNLQIKLANEEASHLRQEVIEREYRHTPHAWIDQDHLLTNRTNQSNDGWQSTKSCEA
jgi:hypothetical protein